ncbi:MAG: amino acid ABC transporter [Chloroflexota bacterium]
MRRLRMTSLVIAVGASVLLACGIVGGDETATDAGDTGAAGGSTRSASTEGPLRIGYLADFSGPLAEFGPARQRGITLAIEHLNDAGGVLGRPVELVVADSMSDIPTAVAAARKLVEEDGVHAVIGPFASAAAIAVAEQVTGPAGIPTLAPSATSPLLGTANDNDFLFRTTLSDVVQGQELARLVRESGATRAAVLYLPDAYGQGLLDAFASAFGVQNVVARPVAEQALSYLDELEALAEDANVLVAITYPTQAQVFMREALEGDLFDRYYLADALRSTDLGRLFGEALDGVTGTSPGTPEDSESRRAWDAAYIAEYDVLPTIAYVRSAYDATIAVALAAAAAGSTDGVAIRDALRGVGAPPGAPFIAGPEGIRGALEAIADGEDVDYEGAANALNWDANGDVMDGHLHIWEYRGGVVADIEVIPVTVR